MKLLAVNPNHRQCASQLLADLYLKNVKIIGAEAGDILFLDSRTWHGTKENKTKIQDG